MRVRIRRNPRKATATQKEDLHRADLTVVRARIYELGVSKFLEDDYSMDGDATLIASEILGDAASLRLDSEEIYERIRREADAAKHLEEQKTDPVS